MNLIFLTFSSSRPPSEKKGKLSSVSSHKKNKRRNYVALSEHQEENEKFSRLGFLVLCVEEKLNIINEIV